MAAATDLVRKKKSNFSTTLSSSIDDTTSTVPISSKSGLPTDTGITLTIDRVDANGNSTPTKMERITGIVNGSSNQIDDSIRGAEGTAQSHSAGAIVEDIWEAATWNDICTAFLVSHTQAGNIKSGAQIDDINQSFQYQLSASVLSADRVVALPALNSADTFVFNKHPATLEGKTLLWPILNSGASGTAIDTEVTLSANLDTLLPSQKAVKTYVDNGTWLKDFLARQIIVNGNFVVNRRIYVSNAALASGVFGHDRWKGGASGGDYTFTQLPSSTQITIKTGKSLIQVIDDQNIVGGTYTLSWKGTAQARFGINSATPSGAYAASPITITTQTAGTVMSVEFNEGTLEKVQLNSGSAALPFMEKSGNAELFDVGRYSILVPTGPMFSKHILTATVIWFTIPLPQLLRTAPTLVNPTDGGALSEGASNNLEVRSIVNVGQTGFTFSLIAFGGNYAIIQALKAAHGLTDAVLFVGTKGILFNSEI